MGSVRRVQTQSQEGPPSSGRYGQYPLRYGSDIDGTLPYVVSPLLQATSNSLSQRSGTVIPCFVSSLLEEYCDQDEHPNAVEDEEEIKVVAGTLYAGPICRLFFIGASPD